MNSKNGTKQGNSTASQTKGPGVPGPGVLVATEQEML